MWRQQTQFNDTYISQRFSKKVISYIKIKSPFKPFMSKYYKHCQKDEKYLDIIFSPSPNFYNHKSQKVLLLEQPS